MSAAELAHLDRILDEKMGAFFRNQGFKMMGSFLTLVVAGVIGYSDLIHRISDVERYDTPQFQALKEQELKFEQNRMTLLMRMADKLKVPYEDLK